MVMATALIDRFVPDPYMKIHDNFLTETHHGFVKNYHVHGDQLDALSPKRLIGDALRNRVENIDHEFCDPGEEDTFFVADLGEVYRQHLRWKLNLPRVKPFYGMSL
jgi:ornithine decarboxylase